jgi:hypothetical protein
MAKKSRRNDRWGSESRENSTKSALESLDLPIFNLFFDSLSFKYRTAWGSEREEPIDRGPDMVVLDILLFDDYFGSLQFKIADQCESESTKPQNDRPQCLDKRIKTKQNRNYRQSLLLLALVRGNALSATTYMWCSHKYFFFFSIVIDTGASVSMMPVLKDFIGPLRHCATANLQGLSGTAELIGEGMVEWMVEWMVRDVIGNKITIRTTA